MSLLPILWALKSAPVVDAEERAIMVTLAESAWSDGTDAFPSKKTIAEIAKIDPKTVQRRLKALTTRGLIALGNQAAAAYIPEHFRPNVYDLMIPYSWFPDIEQVNAERKAKGKPPLTPEDRPDLSEAPPRKQRADKGKRRKPSTSDGGTTSPRGEDSESPGQSGQEGGSTSPGGGDYKSQTGGLQDPQPSPVNPPRNTPRPSVPEEAAAGQNGGTDGTKLPQQISRNPGVDLLLAIGTEKPEFLLTGKTLQDQGMAVAGMLVSGWTPEQIRQIVAGRPLPDQIKTTVGGVVAGRLRQACAAPAPGSVVPEVPAPTPKAPAGPPDGIPRGDCGECGARIKLIGQALDDGLCLPCRSELAGRAVR
jgi:hypothetical protein